MSNQPAANDPSDSHTPTVPVDFLSFEGLSNFIADSAIELAHEKGIDLRDAITITTAATQLLLAFPAAPPPADFDYPSGEVLPDPDKVIPFPLQEA